MRSGERSFMPLQPGLHERGGKTKTSTVNPGRELVLGRGQRYVFAQIANILTDAVADLVGRTTRKKIGEEVSWRSSLGSVFGPSAWPGA